MALVTGRGTARQSWDTLALLLFPSHVTLEVTPGSARVQAGMGFTVQARLADIDLIEALGGNAREESKP